MRVYGMKKSIELIPNLEALFGTRDENLHVLEDGLNLNIDLRSDSIDLEGAPGDVSRADQIFGDYQHLRATGFSLNNGDLTACFACWWPILKPLCGDWRKLDGSDHWAGASYSPRA